MPLLTENDILCNEVGKKRLTTALVSHESSEVVTTDRCVLCLPSPASTEGLGESTEFTAPSRSSASKAELLWAHICELQSIILPEQIIVYWWYWYFEGDL